MIDCEKSVRAVTAPAGRPRFGSASRKESRHFSQSAAPSFFQCHGVARGPNDISRRGPAAAVMSCENSIGHLPLLNADGPSYPEGVVKIYTGLTALKVADFGTITALYLWRRQAGK